MFMKDLPFLLPFYLVFINRKNKLKIFVYSIVQLFFIGIGALSYIRGGTKLKHLSELNTFESIILKFFHIFECIITQIIPFPYFYNYIHFLIYFILFIAAIILLDFKKIKKIVTLKTLDLIILMIVFSVPLAINSELRVGVFSSYFLISLLFITVVNNRFSKIFLGLYLFHNLTVTILSKKNYYSKIDSLETYYPGPKNGFYNNAFYSSKRSKLINLKKYIHEKYEKHFLNK